MLEPQGSPKHWPPLGLPVGSIRAILTLFVVAVVCVNVAKDREQQLDLIWTETLLIAMAHYFTARRFVSLPPDVLKRIQQEGLIEQESHPLFLPRHSIRVLILAAFAGLGWYLYKEHRLAEARAVSLLSIVAAYVLGSIMRGISGWLGTKTGKRPSSVWGDIKAIVVLLAMAAAGIPELMGLHDQMPDVVQKVALGLMLFYFGSR